MQLRCTCIRGKGAVAEGFGETGRFCPRCVSALNDAAAFPHSVAAVAS